MIEKNIDKKLQIELVTKYGGGVQICKRVHIH